MSGRKGLLLVLMEPPAPLEEEFNDWYDTEHFPQRRALPGFETASRWVCLAGWPRWAALYDMDAVTALDTPEYLAVSGANSTPWSRRVLPRTMGRTRLVLEQVSAAQHPGLPPGQVGALVIARYPGQLDAASCMRQAEALAGCRQARAFHSVPPSETVVIAELDRPLGAEAAREALGVVGETGALLLNIYTPYWRG